MPQQTKKQKSTRTTKNRSVIRLVIWSILGILVVCLVGKAIIDENTKQQTIKQQTLTYNQTLADITTLYDNFAQSNGYQEEKTRQPENRCSEHSSKDTAKIYTCGTRGEMRVAHSSKEDLVTKLGELKEMVDTNAFEVSKYDTVQDGSFLADAGGQLTMVHKKTSQECYISGTFYNEVRPFTASSDMTIYSFNCNFDTRNQIFELEDYDK